MATNYIQQGDVIKLPVTAGKTSGAHDMVGGIPVVCLTDRDSDGYAECATKGVFDLSVTGADGSGNSAVSVGDTLYNDSGTLNKDGVNGTEFGVALETVGSGETATINVLLKKHSSSAPNAGAVSISDAGAYTSAATVEAALQELYPKAAVAITDPGNAGAIQVTRSGSVAITTAGAETRTLAIPGLAGITLAVSLDVRVGDCVITAAAAINQTGNNTITLNTAGDTIVLIAVKVGGALVWRVVVNDGCSLTTV